MFYSPYQSFDPITTLISVLVFAAFVLVVVLLVRLLLAATRALNAYTIDSSTRLDLYLADGGGDDPDGSAPA